MTGQAALRVENVTHEFRAGGKGSDERLMVTDDVSFDVPEGQFLAVVGPSGCGKTTVLNMMAGLVEPTSGSVYRNGVPARGADRSVGYMFARSALLPWRSATRNVTLGLEFRGRSKQERDAAAAEWLSRVGLSSFEDSHPAELSQGMRQRVALARILALDPAFLLMDEPFAALDAQTKLLMHAEFIRIWEGTGKTVVFVTHDVSEAVSLADRIVVFSARPGRVKADVEVPLPRPRALDELRFDPTYKACFEQVWDELKTEVTRAA